MGSQSSSLSEDDKSELDKKRIEDKAMDKETLDMLDKIPNLLTSKLPSDDQKEGPDDCSSECSSKHQLDNLHQLAKAMASKSHKMKKCEGICQDIFKMALSPKSDLLGIFLFNFFLRHAKRRKDGGLTLSKDSFESEARKLVDLIRDDLQQEFYVKVFSNDEQMVTQENFRKLLISSFQFWLPNERNSVAFSEEAAKTMEAVTKTAFHGKSELSVKFITHWLEENLPRVVVWMHKFVVHQLTVGHRLINDLVPQNSFEIKTKEFPESKIKPSPSFDDVELLKKEYHTSVGLKLQKMISEKSFFEKRPYLSVEVLKEGLEEESSTPPHTAFNGLLHLSQVWLLSCILPDVFNRAPEGGTPIGFSISDPKTLLAKLLNPDIPTHWTNIYDSDQNGLSLNRFHHHIFGYRGPTVMLARGDEDQSFVVAIDAEWQESTKFWGGKNCMALQLTPQFRVLDRGEKLVYFNIAARGYPFGLQIGSDYKNPAFEIDKDFTRLSSRKIPYKLQFVHVWGCCSQETRKAQLVHKKWELSQVERAKKVNLNACEWEEHPDKYLLELGGRSSYNHS